MAAGSWIATQGGLHNGSVFGVLPVLPPAVASADSYGLQRGAYHPRPSCTIMPNWTGLHRDTSPLPPFTIISAIRKERRKKVARIASVVLPGAANEDYTYGRQATSTSTGRQATSTSNGRQAASTSAGRQATSTSTEKTDIMVQLFQHTAVRNIADKKALRPGQKKLFPKPIEVAPEVEDAKVIRELVPQIKENLSCIRYSEGEVSVSAYDTAWVARISAADGSGGPQFPRTLEWIVANQHKDGSWGDDQKNWLYDRFIQTLACIVAQKRWNHCPFSVQRGVEYMAKYANKLQDEEILSMPIGFELSFPAMLAEAKSLGLDLPYDTPFFGVLEQLREKKLKRVPLELLHALPTTMLHTLEGIQSLDIDWQKMLDFQSEDGSMCSSPSATAVLYMHTRDKKCLSFLEKAVQKFNHAVPTVYPLDTFHNLWVVDTLERLGISRYFEAEIEDVLASVYRSWSDDKGICWARVLKDVPDLDDTSMAFRMLRQHGYKVSADGFRSFQKDKGFACFAVGQMVQGVSDMFNLFRASYTAYPGEEILDLAESFSREFLTNALTKNKGDADKWSLKKDLSGEIEYMLKHPDHNNLKRMQVRHYLEKYGPEDAWIGKSIYRLRLVNNTEYLELAKADFNLCQTLHQRELRQILRCISNSGLADSSNVRERIVMLYTIFSAEVWEPEFSAVRIAAGKCMFIALAMYKLFVQQSSLKDLRQLVDAIKTWDPTKVHVLPEKFSSCFMVLYNTLNEAANESTGQTDITGQLVHLWERLLSSFLAEAEWRAQSDKPVDVERKIASTTRGLEAIVFSSVLMSGVVKNPDVVTWMEKDSTLLRTASEAIALAQGIFPKQDATGRQRDQQMTRELNLQRAQTSAVPLVVKRVLLSFPKVAIFYFGGSHEPESLFELQRLWVSRVE